MEIIIKILSTVLVVIMCGVFIHETIKCIKNKKYGYSLIGIFLIIYYLYAEYRILVTF